MFPMSSCDLQCCPGGVNSHPPTLLFLLELIVDYVQGIPKIDVDWGLEFL